MIGGKPLNRAAQRSRVADWNDQRAAIRYHLGNGSNGRHHASHASRHCLYKRIRKTFPM
jgi:hypothetical protein